MPTRIDLFLHAVEHDDTSHVQNCGQGLLTARFGPQGSTALHWAAWNGSLNVGRYLLDQEILHDPDVTETVMSYSALHVAAMNNQVQFMEMLLEKGADLNAVDDHNRTPLMVALKKKQFLASMFLLDQDGLRWDAIFSTASGWGLVHYGCYWGHLRIVEAIYQVVGPDLMLTSRTSNEQRLTALHIAAIKGNREHLDVVSNLALLPNFDVDVRDSLGQTPLHLACLHCSEDAAKFLIDLEADVHAVTMSGSTVLHMICQTGYHPLAMELVEKYGLEIDQADNLGQRPIHLAAQNGKYHLVRFFQRRGANMEGVLDVAEARGHGYILPYALDARAAAIAEIGRYVIETCNSCRFNERCSCYSISGNEDVED